MDALWASQMQAVRLFFHGHHRCPSRFRWNAYPMSRGTASASPNLHLRAPQSEVVGGSDPDTRLSRERFTQQFASRVARQYAQALRPPARMASRHSPELRSEFDNERRV